MEDWHDVEELFGPGFNDAPDPFVPRRRLDKETVDENSLGDGFMDLFGGEFGNSGAQADVLERPTRMMPTRLLSNGRQETLEEDIKIYL